MQGKKKPAFNKRAGKVFALDYGQLMGDLIFSVSQNPAERGFVEQVY